MPKTLLLADDSVTIQKVVGITFANEDVDLVTVDNGSDALERARDLKPDLVMADVSMPGLDGYALSAAIKADPDLSHIPVLLLTGTFENYDQARAAEAKVDAHIAKPFEAQALVEQVYRLLDQATGPGQGTVAAADTPSGAVPPAASDFGFDDLDFNSATPSAVEPPDLAIDEALAEASERRAGSAGGVAEERTQAEDATAFLGAIAESPGPDITPGLEDMLGDDPPALDPFELPSPDNARELAGSLKADPLSVDPEEIEPAGEFLEESMVLGEAPVREAAPLLASPDQQTVAWDAGQTPLGPKAGQAEDLEWAEPVSADADADANLPEALAPVIEAVIEDPEPAAVISAGEPVSAPNPDAVHEVLEKLAWEAFGPLSEQLVREIVQKVEGIAWEVLPQLAERIIQDEIKRMKAHSSD